MRLEHDDQHAARIASQRGLPDSSAWMRANPDRVEYPDGPPRIEAVLQRHAPIGPPYAQRARELTRWLACNPGYHTATRILNDLGVYGWRIRQRYCMVLRDYALSGQVQRRGRGKRAEYAVDRAVNS